LGRGAFLPAPQGGVGQMVAEGRAIHILDLRESEDYRSSKRIARLVDEEGVRSYLAVPMLREGRVVGGIVLYRRELRAFDDRDIQLARTFADQAAIAIENTRLFGELRSRTEALSQSVGQLTALGEVGQAISSTLDLETVLRTIVQRAVQLAGLD